MENSKQLGTWLDDLQLNHPLVIAGPCSAETEEQVLKIAHELKNSDVSYFRAGIWKPRTRPGNMSNWPLSTTLICSGLAHVQQ